MPPLAKSSDPSKDPVQPTVPSKTRGKAVPSCYPNASATGVRQQQQPTASSSQSRSASSRDRIGLPERPGKRLASSSVDMGKSREGSSASALLPRSTLLTTHSKAGSVMSGSICRPSSSSMAQSDVKAPRPPPPPSTTANKAARSRSSSHLSSGQSGARKAARVASSFTVPEPTLSSSSFKDASPSEAETTADWSSLLAALPPLSIPSSDPFLARAQTLYLTAAHRRLQSTLRATEAAAKRMFDLASEELVEAEAAIHEDLERERLSWRLSAFRGLTNTKFAHPFVPVLAAVASTRKVFEGILVETKEERPRAWHKLLPKVQALQVQLANIIGSLAKLPPVYEPPLQVVLKRLIEETGDWRETLVHVRRTLIAQRELERLEIRRKSLALMTRP